MTIDRGTAGGSARREHERRVKRELAAQEAAAAEDAEWRVRVRGEHPLLGRIVTAFTRRPEVGVESQATWAWKVGSAGEQQVGELLNRCPAAYSLHDRAVPGSRANIDHIALGPAAVYVVDAKRYAGRVESRDGRLFVAGRNRSRLVEGMHRQVAVVHAALADDTVPVRGVLCFVGAEWSLFARPLRFDGIIATWPARLVDLVAEPGPMTVARTMDLARRLAGALPRAG